MQINPKRQILAGELLISSALGSYQKIHGWCVSLLWRAANSCMHAAAVLLLLLVLLLLPPAMCIALPNIICLRSDDCLVCMGPRKFRVVLGQRLR
jgi:hypothetical protein